MVPHPFGIDTVTTRMSLERRFHLLIGLTLGIGFLIFAGLGYQKEKRDAEESLRVSADRVRNVLMATRRVYHHQFIDSGLPLNEKTLGFLPAHALGRISKDLANWDKTGFSFNNVSDQPRNPDQRADSVEMEAIEFFRTHPADETRFVPYTAANGEPYYHYARPIWIEKYCLECHGDRDKAPATIAKLYDTAYGYQVGELRGILSIKIPARPVRDQLQLGFYYTLAWTGCTLMLLWLVVAFLVRVDVMRPLLRLHQSIIGLTRGTLSGRVGALPGVFGDIGEAFDAMAESLELGRARLAASEERFRYLATTATDGIILTDSDGTILFWNEGAESLFGYRQSEIIGHPVTKIIPERFRDAHSAAMARIRMGEMGPHIGHSVELIGLCHDGVEIPIEISLNTWKSEDRRFFVGIVRDIRDRKATELLMVRERTRLETILRTASDGIHILDADGLLIEANDAFLSMLGYDRSAIGKARVSDWDAQDSWENIRARNHALINSKGGAVFETRHRRTDGEMLFVEISACGIQIEDRGFLYCASRDIGGRIAAEAAMREKTEMLIQSNADLEQFAYVASHDLQTPLRNIVSYTQLLERRYKGRLDPDADDFIGFIVDSSKQMSRLIHDLLEYSRVSNQLTPPVPTAAAEAVAEVLSNLKPELERSGATVEVGELPIVMADRTHLVSLFQNLLDNALKYRHPERKPVLSVRAERDPTGLWRFAVADNGIGIDEAYRDKVFEIFQRLNPSANTGGTGIGLTLCRRIVHRFGGTIRVDSVPGQGATFVFTLPDGTPPA